MKRKVPLVNDEVYHILTKSIAGFVIFNNDVEFVRIQRLIKYYQIENPSFRFARFMELVVKEDDFDECFRKSFGAKERLVQIIAYCVMPTHLHLILKQIKDNGISIYMGNLLNSYSRYFNEKYKRKGPLWEGKFKNVLVDTDEYLLHLTRYIHLNPTTAGIVRRPKEWAYSSYLEYLGKVTPIKRICQYENLLDIKPSSYKEFVEDRISYQRELAKIKHLILE